MTVRDPGASRVRKAVEALFRGRDGLGIGMEVEVIPFELATGRRVLPTSERGPALYPVLRRLSRETGWAEGASPAGAPAWRLPDGGVLSWEPGGQLEYSSPTVCDLDSVSRGAAGTMRRIAKAAGDAGIGLRARGIDPVSRVDETELVLHNPRYARMTRHYRRGGPAGERMMRLTAGIHVNLELGADPLARWDAANRLVPGLMAAFANAPDCAEPTTEARSHRAEQWRQLDPTRTGCRWSAEAPVESYSEFALGADAFLLGPDNEPARPFAAWVDRATDAELATHLTTLFPEVRPRGYLELRFFDALPADAYALPAAASAGLLYDRDNVEWLRTSVPQATPARLIRAGRSGVGDPELREEAVNLLVRAAEGLTRLGETFDPADAAGALRRFARSFTAEGLDPGHSASECVQDPLTAPATGAARAPRSGSHSG